jgi:hypothetical protein
MSSKSDSLEEGSNGSHALGWGELGGVPMEEGWEGKREEGSPIKEEGMVVVIYGGIEFKTIQLRELGEYSI